jgi:hypothetical protein
MIHGFLASLLGSPTVGELYPPISRQRDEIQLIAISASGDWRSGRPAPEVARAGLRIDPIRSRWSGARCDAGTRARSAGLMSWDGGADAGWGRPMAGVHGITPAVAGVVDGDVSMSRRGTLTGSGCPFVVLARACLECVAVGVRVGAKRRSAGVPAVERGGLSRTELRGGAAP